MSSSLVPSSGGGLVPTERASKPTRHALVAIRENVMIQASQEEGRFLLERQKLANAYQLTHHAISEQTLLHRRVTAESQGDEGLEMELRTITGGIALAVRFKLEGYLR